MDYRYSQATGSTGNTTGTRKSLLGYRYSEFSVPRNKTNEEIGSNDTAAITTHSTKHQLRYMNYELFYLQM